MNRTAKVEKTMTKFNDRPASQKVLNHLISAVFARSLKNVSTTIVSFPGAGKTAQIKYLVRNIDQIDIYDDKHLFALLDIKTLKESRSLAVKETLTFLVNFFRGKIDGDSNALITQTLEKTSSDVNDLISVFHYLTQQKNHNITVILDSFYLVYEDTKKSPEFNEIVYSIRQVNPAKISFIFIANKEFDESAADPLGRLAPLFIENLVWGEEGSFDEESARCLFSKLENETGYKFSPEFINKLIEMGGDDPLVVKPIATKAINDKKFEDAFSKCISVEKAYLLAGKNGLDQRFGLIVKFLSKKSIEALLDIGSNPTDYLTKAGLVKGTKLINPFFEYFVKTNRLLLQKMIRLVPNEESALAKDILSGQELMVFNLLESKAGQVVSKDEIAAAMWESQWESRYSDWAIDQLLSRIRAKLKETEYPKTIKTLKGRGVMLV